MPDSGSPTVTLENCASEPIHIPGGIQPHGVLLAFDRASGQLTDHSINWAQLPWLVIDAVNELRSTAGLVRPRLVWSSARDDCDCSVHAHDERVIVEFEFRQPHATQPQLGAFVLKSQLIIERLRDTGSIPSLLELAVDEIRALTGFDRVMAYRFRHDDSGEVLAEARAEALEPYLGLCYPASDIPAQARRLYTISTLRLIADVDDAVVALASAQPQTPLDMSYSVLRSVSPIHIEYLRNIDVCASMSVSIVVEGKLWGLLACHHGTAHQVPMPVRITCDLLATMIASMIQSLEATAHADAMASIDRAGARLAQADVNIEFADVIAAQAPMLMAGFAADGLIAHAQGSTRICGDVPEELGAAIASSLSAESGPLITRNAIDHWPPELQALIGPWVGLLALSFDGASHAWLLLMRREQIQTIRWGGQPSKVTGPHGARLTPSGSYHEWRETVRGQAVPWSILHLRAAERLLVQLQHGMIQRHAAQALDRRRMLDMLGHDLRTPLQSVMVAASLLARGAPPDQIGPRIRRAAERMSRLLSSVLDMSRLQNRVPLIGSGSRQDLRQMIEEAVDEMRTAYADTRVELQCPPDLVVTVDRDRIQQVLANLLSNAARHARPQSTVRVESGRQAEKTWLCVSNEAEPIPQPTVDTLFLPISSHATSGARRRPEGLGIGLYISWEIVRAHGGEIVYRYHDGRVMFTVSLPAAGAGSSDPPRVST